MTISNQLFLLESHSLSEMCEHSFRHILYFQPPFGVMSQNRGKFPSQKRQLQLNSISVSGEQKEFRPAHLLSLLRLASMRPPGPGPQDHWARTLGPVFLSLWLSPLSPLEVARVAGPGRPAPLVVSQSRAGLTPPQRALGDLPSPYRLSWEIENMNVFHIEIDCGFSNGFLVKEIELKPVCAILV